MDISVLGQGICHVRFRRLLLIFGMLIAVIVVFQCATLLPGRTLSLLPADKSSIALLVGNATTTTTRNLEPKKSNVVNGVHDVNYSSTLEEAAAHENDTIETDIDFELLSDGVSITSKGFTSVKGDHFGNSFKVENHSGTIDNFTQKGSEEFVHSLLERIKVMHTSYGTPNNTEANKSLASGIIPNQAGNIQVVSEMISDADLRSSELISANISPVDNERETLKIQPKDEKTELLQNISTILNNKSETITASKSKKVVMQPMSVTQMRSLLLQSPSSSHSMRPKWFSVRDRELLSAKLEIENAPIIRNCSGLYASVFRNVSMFKRSYELMERILKVYIYREGEKPIFHQPKMRGLYASEGWFMKLMEGNKKFLVKDPRKAHLFYLPFSSKMLRVTLSGQNFHGRDDLEQYLNRYVELIARKYRFWNRTGGADHFLVACHDWASKITRKQMNSCIRALCNANVAKGFKIGKDTSLPATYIRSMEDPLRGLGGNPPSKRPFLAFFAGSLHGYLRPILLKYWENKELDMKISGPMPRDIEGKRIYMEHMKSSKYCICARGYEVYTPRVVEAIFSECVPVLISDNYVPPFFEVLEWEAFSVFVRERDIPNLRNILLSIPEEKYLMMQMGVKMVQQHFLWHKKPVMYDIFHMILHSVWYNRVFHMT
ncbi:Exostosin family protein [Quillaja saponaria]|uniref:Exostosin family protein n=1 Tax=Quillaja saponaria TaxID=32244 RepID=A0AAD7VFN9_QUISA|nr:Exostosin family protein [Quillaja saponaria]